MANVDAISLAGQTSGTASETNAGSSAKTADYDAFLSLLVTQLKNQDPTAPSDPGEFIAQLATFSSVEQQLQTNLKLTELIQVNLLNQAANVIGLTVSSADGNQRGIVSSVTLTDNGLVAKLNDGSSLTIGDGVVIER